MNKKGFTLLEVLIGTAVLAMMMFMIWSVTSTNLDAQDRVDKRDQVFQMARVAIDRLSRDLNMAFLATGQGLLGKTKDGEQIKTAFIGDDKGNLDKIDFNSFSHWRMFRNAKESEQSEVGYYTEADEENPDLYNLMRRESPYIDSDVQEGGKSYMVAQGLSKFQVSYYDGKQNDWTENWNSEEVDQKETLPKAVKIELTFPDPNNDEETIDFSTIVSIPLWHSPINF